ncbi:hypothetical protein B5M09_003854 [Aphanomyces astaci]|uniref:AMP-dependent synthetase/ligase domain-containing protein n=1 Tax=Aphanomyces astaci TaxID=112090 RepID=A0A3R7YKC9_APHAT|nr:hypothetical protein B5M09_003854 [Aphanomyces astaci]
MQRATIQTLAKAVKAQAPAQVRLLSYTERQARLGRPVSPHVEIYAFPITALSSITNRVTGTALSGGFAAVGALSVIGADVPDEVDIRLTDANKAFTPTTLVHQLTATAAKFSAQEALHYKKNDVWEAYTWAQYHNFNLRFAKALRHIGFEQFDTVSISGFNAPQWFFAFMGGLYLGGAATGIYTTNNAATCQYVLSNSNAKVVVCDDDAQLKKFISIADQLPNLKAIVAWKADLVAAGAAASAVPVYSFESFLELGQDASDASITDDFDKIHPGHCASLIYTSGTTGNPKGVMLSHDNVTFTTATVNSGFPGGAGFFTSTERLVSFLPLSHIAGQLLDIGQQAYYGFHIYFAEPDALKGSLGKTLKEVRPTYLLSVPRVWEKIFEKMSDVGRSTTGLKKSIATWAKSIGSEKSRLSEYGNSGGVPCGFSIANALVLSKVKDALGLDECKAFYSGAAPLTPEVVAYFASLDMPLFEAMGLSETTGISFYNYAHRWKPNSIGPAIAATEARVNADTNELQIRGRHVMMGYLNNPEQTAAAIDADGWLSSGDCARIDADGFGFITGRIKELIITAGGENVPPVLLESAIKEELPIVGHAMAIGDKRKFLTALVSLRVVMDDQGAPTTQLDASVVRILTELGSSATTTADAYADPLVLQHIDDGIKRANLKAASRAQWIQKYKFVPDFSVPNGELTPTLKIKRAVVAKQYAQLIDSLYE